MTNLLDRIEEGAAEALAEELGLSWKGMDSDNEARITARARKILEAAFNSRGGLRIVFDGPPGPETGRFVEIENRWGHSVAVGEWVQAENGLWHLVIMP